MMEKGVVLEGMKSVHAAKVTDHNAADAVGLTAVQDKGGAAAASAPGAAKSLRRRRLLAADALTIRAFIKAPTLAAAAAAKDKIELKQRETMAGTLFPDLQEGGYSPNHLSAKSKSFYLGPKMANYDAAPAYVALPAKHYEPPVHDMRQTKIGHQRPTLSKHAAPKASGSYMPSVSSEASEDAAVEN